MIKVVLVKKIYKINSSLYIVMFYYRLLFSQLWSRSPILVTFFRKCHPNPALNIHATWKSGNHVWTFFRRSSLRFSRTLSSFSDWMKRRHVLKYFFLIRLPRRIKKKAIVVAYNRWSSSYIPLSSTNRALFREQGTHRESFYNI